MTAHYDWAKETDTSIRLDHVEAVSRRRRTSTSLAGVEQPEPSPDWVTGSGAGGRSSPREPAGMRDRPNRGAETGGSLLSSSSVAEGGYRRPFVWVAAIAGTVTVAVGAVRFLEWSGLAGTWWALLVLYAVAIGGGLTIAATARGSRP